MPGPLHFPASFAQPGDSLIGSPGGGLLTIEEGAQRGRHSAIMRGIRADVWPWVESGQFRPVIDSRFSFADAAEAHRRMEASARVGKILLVP